MFDRKLKKALFSTAALFGVLCLLMTLPLAVAEEEEVGAEVYKKRCAMCHGDDGVGDTKAGKMVKTPDINTVPWKNGGTPADFEKTLREGIGKMPKYEGKMSDEEIKAVTAYTIAKFPPPEGS
jgi:cytochrome c6